jgi:hypothetical protein
LARAALTRIGYTSNLFISARLEEVVSVVHRKIRSECRGGALWTWPNPGERLRWQHPSGQAVAQRFPRPSRLFIPLARATIPYVMVPLGCRTRHGATSRSHEHR